MQEQGRQGSSAGHAGGAQFLHKANQDVPLHSHGNNKWNLREVKSLIILLSISQVITDPCTTFLDSTERLFKAFSLAFSSTRKWRLCSLICQHPKSFRPVSIKMQRENINHWETGLLFHGSWNSSTFVHLSCCQVVGKTCSVQLPSPSAVPGWWELPCSVTAL